METQKYLKKKKVFTPDETPSLEENYYLPSGWMDRKGKRM